jgi:DMSO/TMAO reductase YedYZ molybdopterin-dependent catalytic subunit
MAPILSWFEKIISRRGFMGLVALGLARFFFKGVSWAKATYYRVNEYPIRSIEGTQTADLKTWRIRMEGLVENPVSLTLHQIKALPKKVQVKNFICVEGWGLDNQKWEGVHLKEIFSKVKINPKAKSVTFHATGGKYKDSLSMEEALESETMLAYRVNGKDLTPDHGFPLRLIVPRMYAYKGVKWVERIVFTEAQEVGFWEQRGYSPDGSIPGLKEIPG